tara:strand:+ start:535 stop:753 length:219 start_codon:yes stop_codon:yes gene_type:complete
LGLDIKSEHLDQVSGPKIFVIPLCDDRSDEHRLVEYKKIINKENFDMINRLWMIEVQHLTSARFLDVLLMLH